MKNLLHEFFNSKSDANEFLEASQQEKLEKDFDAWNSQRKQTFEEVTEPVMKYISENHHPMMKCFIDCDTAELLEGQEVHKNDSFIQD